MTVNNSGSVPSMFFYILQIDMLFCSIKFVFYNKFIGYFVRPEKFQFMEKWQNRNFDYKIVISVKNTELIL